MSGTQNWQALGLGGLYGSNAVLEQSGAGFTTARDGLDYARMGSPGKTPEAQYPDGLLGTQTGSRRQDRLLDKVKGLNDRSYTRGVHAGERQDPRDYVWPSNWNPERGIVSQMSGVKTPLAQTAPDPRLVNLGNSRPPPPVSNQYMVRDDRRRAGWLLPSWS
jgi:hypothetical protein